MLFFCSCSQESKLKNDSQVKIITAKEKRINTRQKQVDPQDYLLEETREVDKCADRKDFDIPIDIRQNVETLYPDYKIVKNSDFFDNYWCSFYSEEDSPYFKTGDFDGDGDNEFGLILSKNERTKTIIVILDRSGTHVVSTVVDSLISLRRPKMDIKYTKFGYGLRTHKPDTLKTIATDSTYIFSNEFIALYFFEKGSYYYQWTGKEYKRIFFGC
jgi:hypothetical protein